MLSSSSTAAYGTHSLHFGEIQGGVLGDPTQGALQAQLVFGGPNLAGGIALCAYGQGSDGSKCGLAVDGNANVHFGSYASTSSTTPTGYITIIDSSGTTRHLAVVP